MRTFLLTTVALALFGCGSPMDASTVPENVSPSAAEQASPVLANELQDVAVIKDARTTSGTEKFDPADSARATAADDGEVSPESLTGGTYKGCPYGAVCIYPVNARDRWNGGNPESDGIFWSRGAHNLKNQFGIHRVFNNQSGGWTARTCTGYNGTGCQGYLLAYTYIDKDLTPINSITLQP